MEAKDGATFGRNNEDTVKQPVSNETKNLIENAISEAKSILGIEDGTKPEIREQLFNSEPGINSPENEEKIEEDNEKNAEEEETADKSAAESDAAKTTVANGPEAKKKKPSLSPEQLSDDVMQQLQVLRAIRDDVANDTCLTALKRISRLYFLYKTKKVRRQVSEILLREDFADIASNILRVAHQLGIFSSDKVWFPVYYCYNSLWNYTDASMELANQLAEKNLGKLLCANLDHKPFKENMGSKNIYYILKSSMSILHNICRSYEARTLLDSNSVIDVVRFYIDCEHEFLSVLSSLIIAYLTTEKDVAENESLLVQNDDVIKKVVKWMSSALKSKTHRMKGFSTSELGQGLRKLAVVDANKMKIVDAGALPVLESMTQVKNTSVQLAAVELLWSLAFDPQVKTKILEMQNIIDRLDELSRTSEKQEVKDAASGALWVLHKKGSDVTGSEVDEKKSIKSKADGHIFISYNWDNQETVLKIRDYLRAAGLTVWIDVDHMSDNLLESMALAVENASVVLICMSEKYKESPNCRTEGEYSFQQRKPLIPLLMQKRYRADGWLGALVGMKLYLNFSAPHLFETMCEKLESEIRKKLSPDEEVVIHKEVSERVHHVATKPPVAKKLDIENWTTDDVQNWLKNNNLKAYTDSFKKIDGVKLVSLQKIRHEAATFFYERLEKAFSMEFVDILTFVSLLDDLHV